MTFRDQLEAIAGKRSETSNSFMYCPSSQEITDAMDIDVLLRLEAEVLRPLFVQVASVLTSGVLTLASRIELIDDAAQLESTAMYGPDRIEITARIPRVEMGSVTITVKSHGPINVCPLDRLTAFADIRRECESQIVQQIQAVI